jgi:threonine aldolase
MAGDLSRCRPTVSLCGCPIRIDEGLRARGWLFYNFIAAGGRVRLMCGWDTAPETVDRLLDDIRELVGAAGE